MSAILTRWRQAGLAWPTGLALAGLAILIGLGTWQLSRKAWKEALQSRIAERAKAEPGPLAEALRKWHAAGDVVLRGVAQVVAANLRASDRIGRYGGEEFMLILTETDVEEGAVLTEKLRTLVQRQRFSVDGNPDL